MKMFYMGGVNIYELEDLSWRKSNVSIVVETTEAACSKSPVVNPVHI